MKILLIAAVCLILGAAAGIFATAIIASGKQADKRLEELHRDGGT